MAAPYAERDAVEVYEVLRRGGLALVPTDVGYGLVAMDEAAIARIYELKGRPLSKPCVTVVDGEILDELVLPIEDTVRAWIDQVTRLTPLAVVTQLDPRSRLIGSMTPYVRSQATQHGTIATFHNAGALVQALARRAHEAGRLVVGSSANLSGTGNNYTLAEVPQRMRDAADLVLDRGPAWYANDQRLATTILDLATGTFPRKGVNFALIERSWNARRRHRAA